jgi:hypothetical protein
MMIVDTAIINHELTVDLQEANLEILVLAAIIHLITPLEAILLAVTTKVLSEVTVHAAIDQVTHIPTIQMIPEEAVSVAMTWDRREKKRNRRILVNNCLQDYKYDCKQFVH